MQDYILIILPNFVERRFDFADGISFLNCCTFHLCIRMSINHRCLNLCMAKILRKKHHRHSRLV